VKLRMGLEDRVEASEMLEEDSVLEHLSEERTFAPLCSREEPAETKSAA
jgi:hypothetical protein